MHALPVTHLYYRFTLMKERGRDNKEKIRIIIISPACGESCAKYNKPLSIKVRWMSKVWHRKREGRAYGGECPAVSWDLSLNHLEKKALGLAHQVTFNLHYKQQQLQIKSFIKLLAVHIILDYNIKNKRGHKEYLTILMRSVHKLQFSWIWWNGATHSMTELQKFEA